MVAMNYTGAYAGGTTYANGDVATSGGVAYVSIQAANTGHAPASSPTWWTPIGLQPVSLNANAVQTQVNLSSTDVGRNRDRGAVVASVAAAMKLLIDLGFITTAAKADVENAIQTVRRGVGSRES